jgi:AmmeMemoRadiSam system protein B
MVIRSASHAGSWYDGSEKSLRKSLDGFFSDKEFGPGELPKTLNQDKRTILGGVSPHAGYYYSCSCAAHTYLNLFKERIPDTVVILGNDHLGYDVVALMEEGEWETPLGNLLVDTEFAKSILDNTDEIVSKESIFTGRSLQEHNIEIQLPLIKYCALDHDVKIVPIKIGYHLGKNFELFKKISIALADAMQSSSKDIVIVASSDMTHRALRNTNEDYELFKKKDKDVIDRFMKLNAQDAFNANSGSVCGISTITTLILVYNELNATRGKLLQYYASYEKSKDPSYCVGYFSGVIVRD